EHRLLGDLGGPGDLGHGDGVEAALGEEAPAGFGDQFPCPVLLALAEPAARAGSATVTASKPRSVKRRRAVSAISSRVRCFLRSRSPRSVVMPPSYSGTQVTATVFLLLL